jgi:VIT1/CCC1 family predicted Fe2+/Mn2+ transporter
MIYLLTTTFFILQCIDWYTTVTILKGGGYEQNFVMAWVFKRANPSLVMGFKAVILTFLAYVVGVVYPLVVVLWIMYYVWAAYHNGKSLWS